MLGWRMRCGCVQMTSQSLAEKLRMLAEVSNVTITSTEFTESLSEPMVTGVPISNLETWLPKQLAEDHKLWLDVNGAHAPWLGMCSDACTRVTRSVLSLSSVAVGGRTDDHCMPASCVCGGGGVVWCLVWWR
jgi:hypothetical protein